MPGELEEIGELFAVDSPALPMYCNVTMAVLRKGVRAFVDDFAGAIGPGNVPACSPVGPRLDLMPLRGTTGNGKTAPISVSPQPDHRADNRGSHAPRMGPSPEADCASLPQARTAPMSYAFTSHSWAFHGVPGGTFLSRLAIIVASGSKNTRMSGS